MFPLSTTKISVLAALHKGPVTPKKEVKSTDAQFNLAKIRRDEEMAPVTSGSFWTHVSDLELAGYLKWSRRGVITLVKTMREIQHDEVTVLMRRLYGDDIRQAAVDMAHFFGERLMKQALKDESLPVEPLTARGNKAERENEKKTEPENKEPKNQVTDETLPEKSATAGLGKTGPGNNGSPNNMWDYFGL